MNFENTNSLLWGDTWEVEELAGEFFEQFYNVILDNKKNHLMAETILNDYVRLSKQIAVNLTIDKYLNDAGYDNKTIDFFVDKINLSADFTREISEIDNPQTYKFYTNFVTEVNTVMMMLEIYQDYENRFEIIEGFHSTKGLVSALNKFSITRLNINYFKKEAIGRTFLLIKDDFVKEFISYFSKIDKFTKLPSTIENFIKDRFIPLLVRNFLDDNDLDYYTDNSLGYRAQKILKRDLQNLISSHHFMNFIQESETNIQVEKLLVSDFSYISSLHQYQVNMDNLVFGNSTHNDAERLYTMSLSNNWKEKFKKLIS